MKYLRFFSLCSPLGLLWCRDLYLSLLSILSLFLYIVDFHFFACNCPDLPTPFVEEAIFPPFYATATFVKYELTVKTWVYFWALCPVPLVHVSVFMPVPGCFDYHGLVIEFKSGIVIPPAFFFFLKFGAAIRGHLWFHVNF